MLLRTAWRAGLSLAAIPLAVCLQPCAASASMLTTLHVFCTEQNCTDGRAPTSPLAVDAAGDIFGATHGGGITDSGVIFVLKRKTSGRYVYRVIDNLCTDTINCSDGGSVTEKLVVDVSGNVYVAASSGGAFGLAGFYNLSPKKLGVKKQPAFLVFCTKGVCPRGGSMRGGGLTY